jgi:hypothetical protein
MIASSRGRVFAEVNRLKILESSSAKLSPFALGAVRTDRSIRLSGEAIGRKCSLASAARVTYPSTRRSMPKVRKRKP